MNRLRRHIAPLALVLTTLITMLTGCERKDLYLAQRGTLKVDVSVYDIHLDLLWGLDWKLEWQYLWDESVYGPIGYTEPERVRADVYSIDEADQRNKYTTRLLSKEGGRVNLATLQTYDLMFYNPDFESILLSSDELNSYFYATTRSNTKAAYTRSYEHYNQPDQLFGVFLDDLYVTDDPDEYEVEYEEDGTLYYVYNVEAALNPYTFIYLYQVMLLNNTDDAGKRITGCEGISIDGMAGGVDLFTRVTDSTHLVTITQDDTKPMLTDRNLRLPDGTEAVGDIFAARVMTWGIPGVDPLALRGLRTSAYPKDSVDVGIGLIMRNGTVYPIQRNITEQIKQRPTGGVITIVVDAAEIPDSIIGNKPKPGGGFDASVDNWQNEINADITI